MSMQGNEATDDSIVVLDVVALVGDVQYVFLALQFGPVQIERIERPILVVRTVDDELRLQQRVAVAVRINDVEQRLAAW